MMASVVAIAALFMSHGPRVRDIPEPIRYNCTCYEWAGRGDGFKFEARFAACMRERELIAENHGPVDG